MTILEPSAQLAAPNLKILESGTALHRIHGRERPSNAFDPCQGRPTRFAPIVDASGRCVPSLYAGSTFDAVAYETLFRAIPVRTKRTTIPAAGLTGRAHGWVEALRDITLASLRSPDLAKWNVVRASLIASSPKLYKQTATWAKAIHDQFPHIEGLVWTSNQCDPDDAYLFFGDRVSAADLRVILVRDGLADPTLLADVRRAAQRAGITIVV